MCGRIEYHVTSRGELEGHYGVKFESGYTTQGFINARYNIPPTAHTPILTLEEPEEIVEGYWGYVPSWAKNGDAKEVINARAETIFELRYFQGAIEHRRCLIPVTGFYEWRHSGKQKVPFRFHMNDEIFSLAGIYSVAKDKKGIETPHYAIVTTEANELMSPIHSRMPVIIKKDTEKDWISDELSDSEIKHLLRPIAKNALKRDEISSLVNSPKNDSAEVIRPVEPELAHLV